MPSHCLPNTGRSNLEATLDTDRRSQSEKFADLAREVEADPDEKAWDERLKKVVGHRPPPERQQSPNE